MEVIQDFSSRNGKIGECDSVSRTVEFVVNTLQGPEDLTGYAGYGYKHFDGL